MTIATRMHSAVSDTFVARQPIFNRGGARVGYELLYRADGDALSSGVSDVSTAGGEASTSGFSEASRMTSNMLVSSVLTIGLDQLTGGSRAWVNFPRELLLSLDADLLDPERCTIELLETVSCDDEVLAACRALRAKGFSLALDDFVAGDEYAPLLELAQFVKISVLGQTEEELKRTILRLAPYDVQLVAEKVEDAQTNQMCRRLGFTLFQGYHFSRPETMRRRELPTELIGVTRVMNLVRDEESSDRLLVQAFHSDPGLSFKLLRIVNSAAMGGRSIESIKHALQLLGRGPLYRWLIILLATALPRTNGIEHELVLSAVERGRLCEIMARGSGMDEASAASLFLAGLLSTFEEILGTSIEDLLQQVNVSDGVAAALLGDEGPFTRHLSLAVNYVRADWPRAIELGQQMGLLEEMPGWYLEAVGWSREVLA